MSTEPALLRIRANHPMMRVSRIGIVAAIVAEMEVKVAVAVDQRIAPSPLTEPSPRRLLIAIDVRRRITVVIAPRTTNAAKRAKKRVVD